MCFAESLSLHIKTGGRTAPRRKSLWSIMSHAQYSKLAGCVGGAERSDKCTNNLSESPHTIRTLLWRKQRSFDFQSLSVQAIRQHGNTHALCHMCNMCLELSLNDQQTIGYICREEILSSDSRLHSHERSSTTTLIQGRDTQIQSTRVFDPRKMHPAPRR